MDTRTVDVDKAASRHFQEFLRSGIECQKVRIVNGSG